MFSWSSLAISRNPIAAKVFKMLENRTNMESSEFFSALKDRFPDIIEMKDGTVTFKMYVAGNWIGNGSKPVKDPDNNSVLCNVSIADLELVDKALDSARDKREMMKNLSGDEKIAILEKAADLLRASRELFVTALVKNVGVK